MISTAPQTISTTVSRLKYPREDFADGRNTFCIILTSIGDCLGVLPFCPKPGMKLRLHGRYEEKNGRLQFRFTSVKHDAPEDSRALLKYVATLTKGIGEVAVEAIYAQYGDNWRQHIEELPPKWSLPMRRTLDALATDRDRLDAIRFVLSKGGTPRIADLAFRKWKSATVSTITADPYLLATLDGIGFKTADSMREKFGIGESDMRRAVAAVDYALRTLMETNGDSIVDRDALYATIDGLRIPRNSTALALQRMAKDGRIVYVGLDKVTSSAVVKWEYDLARYAVERAPSSNAISPDGVPNYGFEWDDAQAAAICAAVNDRGLSAISGGAGCGKTTIIRAIYDILAARCESVSLCAFAGKAAARLREATGHPASTIHSMLGATGEAGFRVGSLEGQTVILDEASMVPSALLYEITKRNPKRLILVGDEAQLQPVGIGSPFHDVIDCLPTLVHNLKTCYRNEEAVFAAAQSIREGIAPSSMHSRHEDFAIVQSQGPIAAQEHIVNLINGGAIDFSQDLVLSPRNGEGEDAMPCSVKALNDAIQPIVNHHVANERFKVGDRVMCRKNCPALDIWNGTCGWITNVDADGVPFFKSDDNGAIVRVADKEARDSLVPAYCLTIHKSQGSQYRDVYVLCMKRDDGRMFDRSMLYTAVTRAKRACYIICDNGIDRVVNSVHRRNTYLQALLKGDS